MRGEDYCAFCQAFILNTVLCVSEILKRSKDATSVVAYQRPCFLFVGSLSFDNRHTLGLLEVEKECQTYSVTDDVYRFEHHFFWS
jgi:hypothetical protein